jgi:hypothetical protein
MRSLLVILATMLVLAGGFFLYFWMQPETRVARPEPTAQIAPMTQPFAEGSATQPTIRGGEGAWLKHFDDKTLALSYEFRGKKFTPQQNGTVDVEEPEARFYLDRGQLLTIEGDRGNVVTENSGSPMAKASASQMPSRGELHNVVLKLYPSVDATTPSITCKMNNAAFDNDTFSISTASYVDENGVNVPADRVKVEVRGDYEFDGEGLTIRWNQRDRRLQMLEIAHGQRLLVKNPSAIGKTFGGGPATNEAAPDTKALAEATPQVTPAVEAAKAPTTRKKRPGSAPSPEIAKASRIDPIYRASFDKDVRVLRATTQVASADVMHVDFLTSDKHKPAAQPVAAPTTRRARKPSTTRAAAPVTLPTESHAPTSAPTRPAAQPATKRAPIFAIDSEQSQEPLTILWTGKLHVAPVENLEDPPADSKDAVVRMIGAPVILTNEGSELRGASVAFHTGRQDGYVRGSDALPIVTAKDANGAVIQAPNIEYSNAGELATIRGPSAADLPLPAKEGEKPAMVHAQWSKIARIYLTSAGEESKKQVIQRAIFDGEVHINQPNQLDLQTDNLALRFDPPKASASSATTQEQSKQPDLRQMIATGNVRTILTDNNGKTQKINTDKLTLATERDAAGKLYPHVVKANGNVYAADPEQELRAGQMNLVLKPSTRPATDATTQDVASTNVVLDQMDASDNVRVVTASGSIAHGDHLTVQGDEGSRRVDLMGEPFALVGDKDSTLQGKLIHFDEATQKVEVNSPGRLHAIQQGQSASNPTTRPIDVQWQQRLEVQGKQNFVDIFGAVEIASNTSEDQTLAKGNHVHLVLGDKPPTTRPATAESETTEPTTKLANKNSPMNGFGDKVVKTVRLEESVTVNSQQTSDQDVTKLWLSCPVINYDMDQKLMVIDQPGVMLFQQDPIAGTTTQPATTQNASAAKSVTADLSNLHGATAFKWAKEFRYDEAKMQAKMTGNVRIVHQASDLTGPQYELDAGVVTADLEERPTTQPTTQPQQKVRVKKMVADNDVTFRSDKLHFDAQHVDFNPNTHMLIATGTDRAPAELHEAEGFSSGTFTELRMNTLTEEFEVRGFQAQIRRTRTPKAATQP